MTTLDDLWQIEELLWTGGTDALRRRLDDNSLMVFPGVGALVNGEILDSLKSAPRWQSVEMQDCHRIESHDLAALSYRATAMRDGDGPCHALCSSTWRQTDAGWRLVQHHQSRIAPS